MDLSGAVGSFLTGTYTVTRGTASYVDGRASAPVTSTFAISACVQPVSGRELQRLPEGMRGRETRKLYTTTLLRVGSGNEIPDSVSIDGATWEVQVVEPWNILGNYFKAFLAKVTPV